MLAKSSTRRSIHTCRSCYEIIKKIDNDGFKHLTNLFALMITPSSESHDCTRIRAGIATWIDSHRIIDISYYTKQARANYVRRVQERKGER